MWILGLKGLKISVRAAIEDHNLQYLLWLSSLDVMGNQSGKLRVT